MEGKVAAVCISARKGERKRPIPAITVEEGHGIIGDAHAGDWHRQVSLLASESIEKMRAKGLAVKAGDFAENITTHGIELATLPVGTQLRIGRVLLEVTQIGKECHTRCAIYYQAGDCVMPKEGIFARVLRGGEIRPGDRIVTAGDGDDVREKAPRRPRGKYKAPHKPYVISLRLSDDEMRNIHELMEATNKGASELMRDAFHLFSSATVLDQPASAV